jgi:hypothetical protein
MDTELRKKLIVPFTVFLGVFAININTIINAIAKHETWRVVVASVSCLIIIGAFFIVMRSIRNNNKKTP